MSQIKKRKITSKFIENITERKMIYKRRLKGLFNKMEQVTRLCGIEACASVFVPGDTRPSIWPSPDIARELISKFESMSISAPSKRRIDQLTFLEDKGKKLESDIAKINKDNEEILMGFFMHGIENEGKSFNNFDINQKNRLISFMLEKLKIVKKRRQYFEKVLLPLNLPPPPPMSCDLHNGNMVGSGVSTDREVLNHRPLLNLVEQVDHMSSGFHNTPVNNTGLMPIANLSGGGDLLVNQSNFGGFDNNIGSGMEMLPHVDPSGGEEVAFSQGNLEDFNCSMEIPSHINPSEDNNFGGFNSNFRGFDNNVGNNLGIPPHANSSEDNNFGGFDSNFGGFDNNVGSNLGIPPYANPSEDNNFGGFDNNFGGFDNNVGSNLGRPSHANANCSGDADLLLPQSNFEDNANNESFGYNLGSNIWMSPQENYSDDVNMLLPQGNFGGQHDFNNFDSNMDSNMWIPPNANDVGQVDLFHSQENYGGQGNFRGFDSNAGNNLWMPPHANLSGGVDMLLPPGNFGGQVNFGTGGVDMLLPQGNFGNGDMLAHEGNFENFDNNTGSDLRKSQHANHSGVDLLLPRGNFGGHVNFGSGDMLADQRNFEGFDNNTGSDMQIAPHASHIGGDNITIHHQNDFQDIINGDDTEIFNANVFLNN